MAGSAGMSRSAFAAAFKTQVGETPADYLAHWRLAIAQALMRQGQPIKSIAEQVGYGSASALSRVFVQKLGLSPRAWLTQSGVENSASRPPRKTLKSIGLVQ